MPELTDALQGTGHLVVKDGKIEGVNLLKEAFALLKAVGIKQDIANATVFSTIESNLAIKHGVIAVESNIRTPVPTALERLCRSNCSRAVCSRMSSKSFWSSSMS